MDYCTHPEPQPSTYRTNTHDFLIADTAASSITILDDITFGNADETIPFQRNLLFTPLTGSETTLQLTDTIRLSNSKVTEPSTPLSKVVATIPEGFERHLK